MYSFIIILLGELTDTNSGVSDVPVGVLVVERFAHLTVASHGVVQAIVTHSSAAVARCQIHGHVEVTLV